MWNDRIFCFCCFSPPPFFFFFCALEPCLFASHLEYLCYCLPTIAPQTGPEIAHIFLSHHGKLSPWIFKSWIDTYWPLLFSFLCRCCLSTVSFTSFLSAKCLFLLRCLSWMALYWTFPPVGWGMAKACCITVRFQILFCCCYASRSVTRLTRYSRLEFQSSVVVKCPYYNNDFDK